MLFEPLGDVDLSGGLPGCLGGLSSHFGGELRLDDGKTSTSAMIAALRVWVEGEGCGRLVGHVGG